jgi:two-component system sensor histidine kinase BarA
MQVLLGLQSNALKFTEKGYVKIQVSIVSDEGKKFLKISVIDTGIGIEFEDQNKLFKLFGFVNDKTKKLNRNGIGLGLVIAENIVNQYNGKIFFDSVPKKGSTFTFTFELLEERDLES